MQSSRNEQLMRGDRRDYETPRLREFGPVGALTQGGTGQSSEAMVGMSGAVNCDNAQTKVIDPRC
jgi:hypothetical protein